MESTMKITRRIIITVIVLIVFTVSCQDSFLDVKPTGSITNAQLTSPNGLEGTLIGAYGMLLGRGGFYAGSTNWLWGSILGGEANKGTNSGDQAQVNEIQAYNSQTTNESVLDKYRTLYEGVARVNALLRLLPDAQPTVSDATKTRLEAEGKFLRGHYYFELKKIFNNAPYIDETVDYGAGIDEVANNVDLWPKIEADFMFAWNNLPETQSAAGRANEWAAGAYLAKTYLYQGKWADAKTLFDYVSAIGMTAHGSMFGVVARCGSLVCIVGV
jgi:hypothetical protein